MPGFAGYIEKKPGADKPAIVSSMLSVLRYETFLNSGSVLEDSLGLGLGWTCLQNAFADGMPLWNHDRTVGLVFAGEDFTDPAEIQRLRSRGPGPFAAQASYLIPLYEELGDKFYEALNGIFAGVVIDLRRRQVTLFNDRFGLGRVYVHENSDGFYFASEAKALLKVVPALRQIDAQSLGEYFTCGAALQNRTLFRGVALLPGGARWTFVPGRPVAKASYFDPGSYERLAPLSVPDYYEKLRETFTRILPRYFAGPQTVSVSLTGGLDSRMIVAATPLKPRAVPCHTFAGMYRDCADVKLARRIARVCQQDHQLIPVADEFLGEFPALARKTIYCTDGAMDVSGAVELYANRCVRSLAGVRLTGNYGSEILRSNVAFRASPLSAAPFSSDFVPQLEAASGTYAAERRVATSSFIAFKQVPWHHYARLAVEQSQLTVRSPFLDKEIVALAFQAPPGEAVNKELAHRFIADGSAALGRIPTDRGAMKPVGRLGKFCQEFVPRLEYMFDYGMPGWLAKATRPLRPLHVERAFLGRQKFYHFRVWYRDQLASYVREVMLDRRTRERSFLDGARLEAMVTAHLRGTGNATRELHKLLACELIHRELIEGL